MIETMAQTGGWLVLATLRFARMPFLAQVKEAKFRGFVTPGQKLEVEARLVQDGSGYAVVTGRIRPGRPQGGRGRDPLRRCALPKRHAAGADAGDGAPRGGAGGVFAGGIGQWERRVTPDRDALITGIGLVSCLGEGAGRPLGRAGRARRVHARWWTPTRFAPWPVHPMASWSWTSKSPSAATSGRWRPGSASACYAAGLALDAAGVKGNADLLQRDGHDRRGRRRRARLRRRRGDPGRPCRKPPTRAPAERAAAGRSAADAVPGAALQPAGRQYFARAWRGRLVAHLHGRGGRGADAVRIACARIAAGQGDLFLVGGSYNAQRPDVLLHLRDGRVLATRRGRRSPASGGGRRQAAAWCWARSAASW